MGVRYREIPPSARLRPIVQSFWTLDHDAAAAAPQRVVPDGHPELILNLGEPFEYLRHGRWHRQPRAFFAGQIRGPLMLRPNGRARILGGLLLERAWPRVGDYVERAYRDLDATLDTRGQVAGERVPVPGQVQDVEDCPRPFGRRLRPSSPA